jgi:hypothetical protein
MTDIIETHRAEQADAIELIRAAFLDISISEATAEIAAVELCNRWIYRNGRWPTVDEVREYFKGRELGLGTAAVIAAE